MKRILFNDKTEIDQIGFGTWMVSKEDAFETIMDAYEQGYRHFDTAQIYNNEDEIGQALMNLEDPEIFVTTKVWISNYSSEKTFLESVEQSLKRLRLKQVDLLLLHWPKNDVNKDAYKYLEKAKELGYTKSIGVSNFTIDNLKEILTIAKIKPVVNQIQFSPDVQQKKLVEFCRENNIAIEGYSTLKSFNDKVMSEKDCSTIIDIAERYNKSPQTILLRWAYQSDVIIMPKSSNQERRKTNISIDSFFLEETDMKLINDMDLDDYTKSTEIGNCQGWAEKECKKDNLLFDKHF